MTEVTLREQIILDAQVLTDPFWQGERITGLINQAQNWLQLKLIKQGFKNWKGEATITLANDTLIYKETSSFSLPSDFVYDMPLEGVMPQTQATKPAKPVAYINFVEVADNTVLAPSVSRPIFIVVDTLVHLYPRGTSEGGKAIYTKKVADLTFDDTTESTIPTELQYILIERVVMQIKSAVGQEQIKQAKAAEIDKTLSEKYQLDALKVEAIDKGVTQ